MIKLEAITWDNLDALLRLKPRKNQEAFTRPNSEFLAQGYVNLRLGYLDSLKAITKDSTPIGFVKWVHVPKGVEPYRLKNDATLIDAFMLDQAFQGNGLGKTAFKCVLEAIDADSRYNNHIVLLCHEKNYGAHAFFERFNFKKTDESATIEPVSYLWFSRV